MQKFLQYFPCKLLELVSNIYLNKPLLKHRKFICIWKCKNYSQNLKHQFKQEAGYRVSDVYGIVVAPLMVTAVSLVDMDGTDDDDTPVSLVSAQLAVECEVVNT